LANHKSALKRARQSEVRRTINKTNKTRVKSAVKAIRTAIEENQKDKAVEAFPSVVSVIGKMASKGTFHKKAAARKVSRLARMINKTAAQG